MLDVLAYDSASRPALAPLSTLTQRFLVRWLRSFEAWQYFVLPRFSLLFSPLFSPLFSLRLGSRFASLCSLASHCFIRFAFGARYTYLAFLEIAVVL